MAKRSSKRTATGQPRKPARDLELTVRLRQRLDTTYGDLERAIRDVVTQYPDSEKRLKLALARHEKAVAALAFGV